MFALLIVMVNHPTNITNKGIVCFVEQTHCLKGIVCFVDIGGIVNNRYLKGIVCFVDICGIVNHHCLKGLFVLLILVGLLPSLFKGDC